MGHVTTPIMFSSSVSGAFSIHRPARYLLDVPESAGDAPPLLVVALHGYAMNPTEMLGFTRDLLGPSPVIASLEGPNSVFLGKDPRATRSGFHWGTRETADFHVDVHHQMVQGMLIGLGLMLALASVWGFLEEAGTVPHVKAYWAFVMWCLFWGIAQCVLRIRERSGGAA